MESGNLERDVGGSEVGVMVGCVGWMSGCDPSRSVPRIMIALSPRILRILAQKGGHSE